MKVLLVNAIPNLVLFSISPLMCDRSWNVNQAMAVESSWMIHMWSYSHSKIFKAGKVICEIRRLASENLWKWESKHYLSYGDGQHSFHMFTPINKLPLTEHLGAPRHSKLLKPTSVVRYDENWSGLRRILWKFLLIMSCKRRIEIFKLRLSSWNETSNSVTYRQFLPPHVGLPGLRLQDEQASWAQMSVNSLKEPFEATVSPVQVNPFGDAQAQDHVILLLLSQQQVIIIQYIIGLKKKKLHPL